MASLTCLALAGGGEQLAHPSEHLRGVEGAVLALLDERAQLGVAAASVAACSASCRRVCSPCAWIASSTFAWLPPVTAAKDRLFANPRVRQLSQDRVPGLENVVVGARQHAGHGGGG
ncbi:hypothetical protein [Micromonospora pallida]|uniref:hypothetical protein n=1 Tax=Micromonospora pallida TaxID=145854 RepID=UPI000B838483|nr:hypothetical protein [Micromonospora pallida]